MPKGLLQEKFQRTLKTPSKNDGENSWTSFDSQRVVFEHPTKHITHERVGAGADADFDTPATNRMPPGMFIDNQLPNFNGQMADGGLAGSTDVTNESKAAVLSPSKGFTRHPMKGDDEMYTNEHVEGFYGEATVDGKTGFLERNNYLDRT